MKKVKDYEENIFIQFIQSDTVFKMDFKDYYWTFRMQTRMGPYTKQPVRSFLVSGAGQVNYQFNSIAFHWDIEYKLPPK